MCIKGSLGSCLLFVHWPYRGSPSPKFRGSSSFPICWVKSGPSVRVARAGGQPGASSHLRLGSASVLPGELLAAAERQMDGWMDTGTQEGLPSFPSPPSPSAVDCLFWCLAGLGSHVGLARSMLPAASWKLQVFFWGHAGSPGWHTHSRSHTYSCISTHSQLRPGISTAESFPRERHFTGAVFMEDDKKDGWKSSLLVPRSFHLRVSSDPRDKQDSSGSDRPRFTDEQTQLRINSFI